MNRLSADASLLLKSSGYGTGFFQQAANGAHPMPPLSHNNSQAALMMGTGVKSPARDLGGGSTPALKSCSSSSSAPAAHTSALPSGNNSAAQVITSLFS